MIIRHLVCIVFISVFCSFEAYTQLWGKNMSAKAKNDTNTIAPHIPNNVDSSSVNTQGSRHRLQLQINHEIALRYSKICELGSFAPAIGNIGWEKVKMYREAVPKLQESRDAFEQADKKFSEFMDKKIETDSIIKSVSIRKPNEDYNAWKRRIFAVLDERYHNEYQEYMGRKEMLLGISNRECLAYIIEDFHKKSILFPIDWIPAGYLRSIRRDSAIVRLENGLKSIDSLTTNYITQEKLEDYSKEYKLSDKLIAKGYSVLYVSDKKDVVVLLRKDQKRKFKVGEFCEFDVLLNKDRTQKYNLALMPSDRSDFSHQYDNTSVIWTSGKSLVTIGATPHNDNLLGPTACTANKMLVYIGKSESADPCCKPSFWDHLEEYEFYFPITWE